MPLPRLRDRVGTGLVRRVVLPLALVVAVTVPSLRVLGSAALPDLDYLLCQMHLVKADEPASDVVFLGSSRTGAAVDATVVADRLDGDLESAEKVVLTLGSELDRDLAYRTYVEHRGAPRVLAIEMSFERYSDRTEGLLTWPTGRSATLFGAREYGDLVGSLRERGAAPLEDTYVRSRVESTPSFLLDRLNVGLDQALRSPDQALRPTDTCSWSFEPRRGRWVAGDTEPFVEAEAEAPPLSDRRRWRYYSSTFGPLRLSSEWTRQEVMLVRDLVAAAYDDGVETVVLYYLPSFRESPRVMDLDRVARLFPDTVVFDGRTVLLDDARPSLRLQYNDMNHLNIHGAYEISRALGDLISERSE